MVNETLVEKWNEERTRELEAINAELVEALELAEDVLARFPYSTELWPNGTHPMTGITKIRDAIARAKGTAR